jgi:hypothetical protein
MKSTFKKQRRGSKKNKSQRKSRRRSYKKMMKRGGSYVGKEGDIYKVCEKGPKDTNCMYILPSVINDLGTIKPKTGMFSTIDKDWKEIRKNIDSDSVIFDNVIEKFPDVVPPRYEDLPPQYTAEAMTGGKKYHIKRRKGKKSKKSNSRK